MLVVLSRPLGVGDTSGVVGVGLVVGKHLSAVCVGLDDGRLAVEEVDLLEGKTLSLGNAEADQTEESQRDVDDECPG